MHHPVFLNENAVHGNDRRLLRIAGQQLLRVLDFGHADRLQAAGKPLHIGNFDERSPLVAPDPVGGEAGQPGASGSGALCASNPSAAWGDLVDVVGVFGGEGVGELAGLDGHGAVLEEHFGA
jgi:hypothetical protein